MSPTDARRSRSGASSSALEWTAGAWSTLRARLGPGIAARVGIDARALAVFRMALGSLVVADLLLRARNLTAFYTDRGVLPTGALYSDYTDVHSIHAWWGEPWIVAVLFVAAAAFGVAMILGYRTRTVTLVSWVLLVSLQNRNPMVLNGGDVLLRLLLFWGIFLPLGERWSLDALRSERRREWVASVATLAVLVQLVLVYTVNFVHKTRGEDWVQGTAVPYILSLGQFTVYLGPTVAAWTPLLEVLTLAWLVLMALSPFLLVLRGWPRALLATAFVSMHLGMAATMKIGLFPLVVVAAILPFYPPVVWDALETLADRVGISDRLARVARAIDDRRPASPLRRRAGDQLRRIGTGVRPLLSTVLPALFLVLVLATNAHVLDYADAPPEPAREVVEQTETDQQWRLFAPNPLSTTYWWVGPAKLEDGSEVDALHGGEVTWDRPPNVARTYDTARWRKYHSNVYSAGNRNHRAYLANYLCERWNRTHGVAMESVELYVVSQAGAPYGEEEPVHEHHLITYDCDGPLRQY